MWTAGRGFVVLLAAWMLAGCGFTGNLRSDPGFAVFDSPGFLDTDRQMALSLGPMPLSLARLLVDEDEDPEAAALLKSLDAVRLYIYEIDGEASRVHARVQSTVDRLDARGWESVVAIREDDELVRVMVRTDRRDHVRGMVVLAQDGQELVLINLIGDIRPEFFNDYMDGLDINAPEIEVSRG